MQTIDDGLNIELSYELPAEPPEVPDKLIEGAREAFIAILKSIGKVPLSVDVSVSADVIRMSALLEASGGADDDEA